MKINISAKELKEILSGIIGICVEIGSNDNFMNKPEEPTVLSDEEVHNNIVQMCTQNKLHLYINELIAYSSNHPDYDRITEALRPYDGEIVSIISINDSDSWYVNTL